MLTLYDEYQEKQTDNGFILPFIYLITKFLYYLNIVELLKRIVSLFTKVIINSQEPKLLKRIVRRNVNYTIDLFILVKFLFIILLWKWQVNNKWALYITLYLLFMNTFTYFYYHIWEDSTVLNLHQTVHRVRRRFVNLFISIFYMIISYGYLYHIPYQKSYTWLASKPNYLDSLIFSISNSFATSYSVLSPNTNVGELIKLSQTLTMFIFVVVILARSIPQANKK